MNRLLGISVAVVTAILNWFVFLYFARLFGSYDPAWIATILTVSMVVHELGHLAVLEASGIKTHVFFLVLFGGAMPTDEKKYKKLPWSRQAAVNLAGVVGNIIVVGGGIVLYHLGIISNPQLDQIINLNGILIFFNLLPFWKFDGGRFARTLFDSVAEEEDRGFAYALGYALVGIALLVSLVWNQNMLISAWLVFWGLQYQAKHDDPNGNDDKRAMTRIEQIRWSICYLVILLFGMEMILFSNSWLN